MPAIWRITKLGLTNAFGGDHPMVGRQCHMLHDNQDTPEMT